jgi:WD40 repeat protein
VVSPDGTLLATACGQTVELWEVESGRQRFSQPWRHDSDYVRSLAFSPDGSYVVSASDDDTVRIWDVESGQERHRLQHADVGLYGVNSASFSPDSRRVVSAAADGARLWDVETGQQLSIFAAGDRFEFNEVEDAIFTAGGRFVVTERDTFGNELPLQVWDADTGALRFTIPSISSDEWSLDPLGQSVVTWQDGSAQVWDLESGEAFFSEPLTHQERGVWSAFFSPDGQRLLTTTADETRVWMISPGLLQSAVGAATVVCLAPDLRQRLLGETHADAGSRYEACEQSHGRTTAR